MVRLYGLGYWVDAPTVGARHIALDGAQDLSVSGCPVISAAGCSPPRACQTWSLDGAGFGRCATPKTDLGLTLSAGCTDPTLATRPGSSQFIGSLSPKVLTKIASYPNTTNITTDLAQKRNRSSFPTARISALVRQGHCNPKNTAELRFGPVAWCPAWSLGTVSCTEAYQIRLALDMRG